LRKIFLNLGDEFCKQKEGFACIEENTHSDHFSLKQEVTLPVCL